MFAKQFLVFDAGDGGSVPDAGTPPADGSVANATPPTPAEDAEKAALKATNEKYEQDIRQMKASLQRNESLLQKKLEEREKQYREEMDRVRRSLLDKDDLEAYEVELTKTNLARLEQQYAEAATALEQERAIRQTIALFAGQGVPVDILLSASDEDGLNGVTQAAWGWLINERKRLSELAAKPPVTPKTQPTPPPEAPKTSTETAPAFTGPKWPELIKQYGSREVVYTLVESGRLPATIIPPEG